MKIKKFKKLGEQSLVFIGIYALMILILAISRIPQSAFDYSTVKASVISLGSFAYVTVAVLTLALIGGYYKLKK